MIANQKLETQSLSRRFWGGVVVAAAGSSAIMGAVVMFGWFSGHTGLIHIFKGAPAMQFNTSLAFFFTGLGLFSLLFGRRTYACIGGAMALTIGALTLFQYITGINLGIDQLLMRYYLPWPDSLAGRMVPNTAIAFMLSGTAILLSSLTRPFYHRSMWVAITGTLIFSLGTLSLLGFFIPLQTAGLWGTMSRMAFHTACGFIILGLAIFLLGWREGQSEDQGSPNWLAFPIGILLAAITFFQWQVMLAQEKGTYILLYPAEKSPMPQVILVAGILMSVLITITIHQAKKLWNRSRVVNQANRILQAEISERIRAQEARQKSEEKYRLLADNTLDCIWCMDLQFTFTYINPSVLPLFGFTPEEWIGSNLQDHCSSQHLAPIQARLRAEFQQPDPHTGVYFETELLHRDGYAIPVEINAKSLRNPANQPLEIQGTIRNISKRKEVQAEKERLEELLRHAQKMEAIGTLAGGIAHDFNNILGIMMGYTEISMDELPMDSQVRHNLRQVLLSAERARDMIKQILAFSRKNQVERQPIFLAPVIREAEKLLRASLPSTIAIETDLEEELEPVMADATQMHQVLMNLGTNAAHAMRETGGLLRITLRTIRVMADDPDAPLIGTGWYRVLTTADTGHGIHEETQKRIFEPYFTTKPMGEGTGMGLAVVHGIIKDHGGSIRLLSKPGTGTTFTIYLPVTATTKKPVPRGETKRVWLGGNECILLVDDEQVLVEMGRKMLSSLGYDVVARASSIEALEAFKSTPEKFQLVITDQTMPNMTGVQLAREIKKIRPEIRVILCSGFSENVNEDNYMTMGVDAFIMKPILKKHIAPLIRNVLDRPV